MLSYPAHSESDRSSGEASSMHGDFINGWDQEKLADLVKTCLNQTAKCGTTPTFAGG